MQKFDHPAAPANPYPDDWEDLRNFRFRSALSLIRPLGSVRNRLGEDAEYVLQHDLLAEIEIDGELREIRVPRGLITDLTSVPAVFRIFVSRVGPWLEAAVLHDYLYIAWQDVPDRGPREADRAFADEVFRLAMIEADVSTWRRILIHQAVRIFGGKAFSTRHEKRYTDLNAPELKGKLAFVLPTRRDTSETPSRA